MRRRRYIQFGEHLHRVPSEAGLLFKDLLFEYSALTVACVLLQSLTDVVQATYGTKYNIEHNAVTSLLTPNTMKTSGRKSKRTTNLYARKDDIKQHSQQEVCACSVALAPKVLFSLYIYTEQFGKNLGTWVYSLKNLTNLK